MSTKWLAGGFEQSSHVHKLVLIKEPPYQYRCVECGTRLQRKSGYLVSDTPAKHKMMKQGDVQSILNQLDAIYKDGGCHLSDANSERLMGAIQAINAVLGNQSYLQQWIQNWASDISTIHNGWQTFGRVCECAVCVAANPKARK